MQKQTGIWAFIFSHHSKNIQHWNFRHMYMIG
jgi:hypothetical protein